MICPKEGIAAAFENTEMPTEIPDEAINLLAQLLVESARERLQNDLDLKRTNADTSNSGSGPRASGRRRKG